MRKLVFIVFVFLMVSCNQKSKNETVSADNKEDPPVFIFTGHGISFTTSDYENWRAVYKEKTNDLDMLGIYQSMEEENVYVVFERNEGHQEAERFLQSRNFKNMAAESGSKTTQVIYFNVKELNGELEIPYALGVTHKISDWDKWNKHWSKARSMHESNGMQVAATSIDANNDKLFYIWFAVKDIESVKAFIKSHHEQNQGNMSEHGVKGSPNMSWWKTIERKN